MILRKSRHRLAILLAGLVVAVSAAAESDPSQARKDPSTSSPLQAVATVPNAEEITIDCSQVVGEIRPLHGANFGPLCANGTVDLTQFHRDLGLPSIRLHDIPWTYGEVVDIHTLFRDPRADPSNPESYDFRRTDDYLLAVTNTGARVIFRLGESIEHTPRKYWVHPPPDFTKWAQICIGVIRHYNEGWAGGFRHGIQEWEIWNEPENQPACWTGTDADYYRLYEVTARALKARWPELRVGGPAVGNTGQLANGRLQPSRFVAGFLAACRDRHLPLDFFSWHAYTDDPKEIVDRARAVRGLLDRHGFNRASSYLDEWNYLPGRDWSPFSRQGQGAARERMYDAVGGSAGSAFVAATLLELQDAPVDMANFFSADNQGFGLFTPAGSPRKNFHAFRTFRRLLETPVRIPVLSSAPKPCSVIAGLGRDRRSAQALLANPGATRPEIVLHWKNLPWTSEAAVTTLLLNADHDSTTTAGSNGFRSETPLPLVLPPSSVMLVNLTPR